jgi:glycosyl transferase family 25
MYPPAEINKYIDAVIYINLDRRGNRNKKIIEQLSVFDKHKVHRSSAVDKADNKILGCALSHLNALKMAKEKQFKNVLILEDDAIWANIPESYAVFKNLIENPYDVIMLGATYKDYDKTTYRINYGLTASSYLVNSRYYDKIIHEIEKQTADPKSDKNVDIMYTNLQKQDIWYVVMPALMIQGKSMSNLQGYETNYKNLFK